MRLEHLGIPALMYEADNMAASIVNDLLGSYHISWLAHQLHSIPRRDMAFNRVNATFKLDSQHYKEVGYHRPPIISICISSDAGKIYSLKRYVCVNWEAKDALSVIKLAHCKCKSLMQQSSRLSVVCLSRITSRKLSEIGATFRRLYRKSGSLRKNMTSDFALEVANYQQT